MSLIRIKGSLIASALLILSGSVAQAETLWVDCGAKLGLNTIGAALKALQHVELRAPVTIQVSGACRENLLIKDAESLTLAGVNGASITDASGGALDVIDIRNARVSITGMTIDGLDGVNADAVDCEQGSHCTLLGNMIRGNADVVGVYSLSSALIVGGVIENGTSNGILALGDVVADGVAIQGNPAGVVVRRGGRAVLGVADPQSVPIAAPTSTVVLNNGTGVLVNQGAELSCVGCAVRDNSGDGIHIDVSTAATIQGTTLSNGSSLPPAVIHNSGHGIYVGDLSSATFKGASTVTGNGLRDISCNSPTSVTRGAVTAAGGTANTNCTN